MARVIPPALVLALLAGTAVAFAVTERLKLVRSPIAGPRITKLFSPVCGCPKDEARIRFRLRTRDTVDVAVVDDAGDVVRTLFTGRRRGVGAVTATWDGRDDAGRVVAEGRYRPRVHLDRERRTIVLPNPIVVDTTSPTVRVVSVRPRAFSPDGDGRSDKVSVAYELDEPAHGVLFAGAGQVAFTRAQRTRWKVDWNGIDDGRRLSPGTYALRLAAEDRAGNRSEPVDAGVVHLRYLELGRALVRVPPGVRFGIGVDTDARSYRWLFAGRRGVASGALLVVRAPSRPGRYTLFVEANGHADRARVVVRGR
ncbi:MAG TPA: FlgD immunoglobulin-like domain containing protein [Gaiellaceae bacterium]|nr:FlgD immunoglobulin-like domain containing protein [Gaiellaceae bacterium]